MMRGGLQVMRYIWIICAILLAGCRSTKHSAERTHSENHSVTVQAQRDSIASTARTWQWCMETDSSEERVHAVVHRIGDSALVLDVLRGTYRQRGVQQASEEGSASLREARSTEEHEQEARLDAKVTERERHATWSLYAGMAILLLLGMAFYYLIIKK